MLCLAIVASYKRTLESIPLALVRGGNLQGLRNLIVFDRVAHSFKSCSLYLCFECRFTCQRASETNFCNEQAHFFVFSGHVCSFAFIHLHSEQVLLTE